MSTNKLYEGKAKRLFESENDNQLIIEFKDVIVGTNGNKLKEQRGKGAISNQISTQLFRYLESYHIATYFVKELSDRQLLIKKLDMIPILLWVRNFASGSLVEKYGLKEGKELECPIIEYYLNNPEKPDAPMINEDHVISFGHATSVEIKELHRLASKTNAILKDYFRRRNLKLIDLKLEFGRLNGKLTLACEINPDSCNFWDHETDEKFELDTQKSAEANYEEIKNRLLS